MARRRVLRAENDKVSKLTDLNGDGSFTDSGERVTVTSNIPGGGGHTSRTVHIGPDGKLYVAAGSSSNNNVETDKRRADLRYMTFHQLRHACATFLLAKGVDLQTVSKMLGHSQISLTADTYAHVLPSLKLKAADRMDDFLRREVGAG
jgi:integrase